MIESFFMKHLESLEMLGVIMRIVSFTLISWFGALSPFMFIWIFNTVDAVLLTYIAILRKNKAYTLLNFVWILVGVMGIIRTSIT